MDMCASGCDSILDTYNKIIFLLLILMTELNESICHGVPQGGWGVAECILVGGVSIT